MYSYSCLQKYGFINGIIYDNQTRKQDLKDIKLKNETLAI